MKLVTRLYVRINKQGNEEFFEVSTHPEADFDHGDAVGIYELKEVRTLVKKGELVL